MQNYTLLIINLKKKFFDAGNFIFIPCKKIKSVVRNLENNKPCHKFLPYFIENSRAIDINTNKDLKYAEIMYKINKKKL